MPNRMQHAKTNMYALALFTLMSIVSADLAAQTYEVKFDLINAYGWFGGDNRPMSQRTVGVGQSVFIDTSITLNNFSFYFRGPFDYAQNPEGRGHEVTLTLNVRDALGAILRTVQVVVPDTFQAGWVSWSGIALDVAANSTLIFTTYLVGGFDVNQYTASHGADFNQGYTSGIRYVKDGTGDADMEAWTDWTEHQSWDSAFRLEGVIQSATSVDESGKHILARFELSQNYPNPFNPSTVISFQLPAASEVQLVIYNTMGQLVKHVASGAFSSGTHQALWDGTDDFGRRVASGSYFYQLIAGDFQSTRRMLFIK